ncbi:hypothetical protein [Pseudomonas fluorescens]|uniref:hypothetical protein n=1 Tax=Pseudomonas fluorescens TaxID=294 RepID=UPI0038107EC0
MTGVPVSPIAASGRGAVDGRFIVSGCLRKSLALYESHTTTVAGIEEAHGDAGS